jgi:hypothetical protein
LSEVIHLMRKLLLIATLTSVILLPATLRAQTPTNDAGNVDEVRKSSRIHVGPFYINTTLLLKEVGVDTNVFNQAGEQKSDFTMTVTPQADVAVTFARRGLLKATVGSDLVYYQKYDTERSINPLARVRAEAYAHRLTLFAEDTYLNTRQRPNFEIDLRSRHLENDLQAGARLHLTPKFSIEVAARRAIAEYDADAFFDGASLRETLNRSTEGLVGVVRDRVTPLTTVAVKFDRLTDTFTYSPVRDSRSFRVMPGVEFKPRALVSGNAWVGYRRFTPETPGILPEFSGLVADLGLSYTLLGSTSFGVSYHRDLAYSYEVDNPFYIDNSIGASIRRALGGKFDTIVSADRHTYDYEQLLTLPASLLPRSDTTWVYGANIGYRVRRLARIGFGVNYYKRDSTTVRLVQYDGLRFGATMNYGF